MNQAPATLPGAAPAVGLKPAQIALWGVGGAVAIAWPLVFTMPFPQHLGIMILLYAALGQAWNVLGGFAGQVSFGHAVFFGIGAYTSVLLQLKWNVTPWIGMLVGGLIAVLVGAVIGKILFRMSGHYFAIATIAINETVATVVSQWEAVGGAVGLTLPMLEPSIVHFQWISKVPYYYIALGLTVVAFGAARLLERSRAGYYFRAIKADQSASRALGIDIARYKLLALSVSAFLTALCGSFLAHYVLFVDPTSVFAVRISILISLIAVLGGAGSYWGPLLGAMVLIPLSEYTRVWFGGSGKALDLLIYGALIMLIAVYQPTGLWGLVRRLRRKGAG